MKSNQTNILLATLLIVLAAASRILTSELHIYNIAPVAAVGLFSGAIIKDKRFAYILPLLAMFISDLYFQLFTHTEGFYGISQAFVYAAMAVVTFTGTRMGKVNATKVLGFSLSSSVIFFILSNFGTFVGGYWGTDMNGFVTTFTMAIPFFKNTLASDLIGNAVLFGLYFGAQHAVSAKLQKA